MELKLRRERPPRFSPSCFNRTFMELKLEDDIIEDGTTAMF